MRRHYLNLGLGAWLQLARAWRPRPTGAILAQMLLVAPLLSFLAAAQGLITRRRRHAAPLSGTVVILGYWRSGTTLLHELLCSNPAFAAPTTYACMNPHHFALTEGAALARPQTEAQRPMDGMTISSASPQEEEFALLGLGARSPYEAFLFPEGIERALRLADPDSLTGAERRKWRRVFRRFLQGVSIGAQGRRLALKSPPHGYRIDLIREMLPDARFVLIVRDNGEVFESTVKMWRAMSDLYALGPGIDEERLRAAILADRTRFEARMRGAIGRIAPGRFFALRYEDLVASPAATMSSLYEGLGLGDFGEAEPLLVAELDRRAGYQAARLQPPAPWGEAVATQWAGFERQPGA